MGEGGCPLSSGSEVTMPGLGASKIHLKERACRSLIFGEEKHPNQWHLCENLKGEVSEVSSETGMGWLPRAAVLNWEMMWDCSLGVFKGKGIDFCVIQRATRVIIHCWFYFRGRRVWSGMRED